MEQKGCLICGEGMGYFDNGQPCWGCNYIICSCGQPMPYDVKCVVCGKVYVWKGAERA